MHCVIGVDEAGYGPNLGPLVVTATSWELPDELSVEDFWEFLHPCVSQNSPSDPDRIHVADSKLVHSSSRGIANLERSVSVLLESMGVLSSEWHALRSRLEIATPGLSGEPWFDGRSLSLPVLEHDGLEALSGSLTDSLKDAGVRSNGTRTCVLTTREFNRRVADQGSKGVVLSQISLELVASLWSPEVKTLVICDKHGGRNRYDDFLQEICEGEFIFRIEEGRARSVYRTGRAEFRFQTKAEQFFPVAVASMISKYLRETAMELFNCYWTERIPGLKPTKGYPEDALRFRRDVEMIRQELGIPDDVFWRNR
ncbi:MAG TPA: hypothetical protein VMM56_09920 [Planctomycetaceae bacterium]|nr:hypothetical protein [Planctomycetaceae bacterium]